VLPGLGTGQAEGSKFASLLELTVDVESQTRLCIDPFAIDKGLLLEQRRVVELYGLVSAMCASVPSCAS
jgi:hypothetical protein